MPSSNALSPSPSSAHTSEILQSIFSKVTRPYQNLLETNFPANPLSNPLTDGVQRSIPSFSVSVENTISHEDRYKTTDSPFPWRSTQSLLRPYGCLNEGCARTFTNISGLLFHANQERCSFSADLSLLSPPPARSSPSPIKTPILTHESTTSGNSAPDSFFKKLKLSRIRKVSGRFKRKQTNPFESVTANDDIQTPPTDATEKRINQRTRRPTSAPDLSNSFRSQMLNPSRVTQFPPPPPFEAKNIISQRKQNSHQSDGVVSGIREARRKDLRRSHIYCSREHTIQNGLEIECSDCKAIRLRFRSRSLSSSKLSERDPVLSRPYSRPSSRTFPKSLVIDTVNLFKPPSPASSNYSISILSAPSRTDLDPVGSLSRLAKPLPILSQDTSKSLESKQKSSRRQKQGRQKQGRREPHEDAYFASIGMCPRRISSRSSFGSSIFNGTPKHVSANSFARLSITSPKSSRPSSLYSSRSSLSLSSSVRRLSSPMPPAQSLPSSRSAKRAPASFLPSWQFSPPPFVILEDYDDTAQTPPALNTPFEVVPKGRVRRGYWNQRGDFLTPDGFIVYAPPDQQYPEELQTYPPPGIGFRDDNMDFVLHSPMPELPESIPMSGRPPEQSYNSFIVYEDK